MSDRLFLYGIFKVKYIFDNKKGKGHRLSLRPGVNFFCELTAFKYRKFLVIHIPYFDRRFAVEPTEGMVREFIDPNNCEFIVSGGAMFLKIFGFYNKPRGKVQLEISTQQKIESGLNGLDPFGGSCITETGSFKSWTKGPCGPKGQTGYGQTYRQRKK